MEKPKIYFPISEECNNFIGLTNSKDGLVLPILFEEGARFHVTISIINSLEDYSFDVHVTDEKENKHFRIFRAIITKPMLSDFREKCKVFAFELLQILKKYFLKADEIDKNNLYCLGCSSSIKPITVELSKAEEFWKSLNQMKEEDLIICKTCTNPEHKTLYDAKQKILLHKINDSLFLAQDSSDKLFNEISSVYEKHFSEEMKTLERITNDVVKIIKEEHSKVCN